MKHVEIGYNRLPDPKERITFPDHLETLILESNEITSLAILGLLQAPKYPLPSYTPLFNFRDLGHDLQ